MKIEYDQQRDLLYVWFREPGARAARTDTLAPGIHADFDSQGHLIGLEVLEASATLGGRVQFELALSAAG